MNSSRPESDDNGDSSSLDYVNLVIDSEADNVARPPSPAFLKWANAERERLAKIGFNLDGTRIKPKPESDAK